MMTRILLQPLNMFDWVGNAMYSAVQWEPYQEKLDIQNQHHEEMLLNTTETDGRRTDFFIQSV